MFTNMSRRAITILVSAVFALVSVPILVHGAFANLDASEIMVIQAPFSGELTAYVEPGTKWAGWGTTTKYRRREQYSFSSAKTEGNPADQSIKTFFNDGGDGNVSGVISWEMPLKPEAIIRLHKEYHSFTAIDQQLIRPMLEKVMFGAGATMSTTESSSERRTEIPQIIDDQLQNGPYLTHTVIQTQKDPITGTDKPVRVVQIVTDEKGKAQRTSASTIKEYGITLSPVTVNNIVYSKAIQDQINERQKATQSVQLSQAAAIRATQDAITTAKQGEADAAKAKWAQETLNAKEIALAEKDKKVAELSAETAAATKRKLILEGEGEASKRRSIMEADGALDKKLAAYVEVNGKYADAIKAAAPGAWTPSVVMGQGSGGGGANALMEMFSAKAARDLGVDLQAQGTAKTKK